MTLKYSVRFNPAFSFPFFFFFYFNLNLLFKVKHKGASPCEKSEEKGQRQKVTFVCLNMKENKTTGHKSTFLASLFCVLEAFWPYWVWAKKCLFFRYQILIFISYFDQQNIFGQNWTWNAVFTIRVPEKNAFLGSCHRFQEVIVLPKQFCRTKKNFRSMPISSDVGQLKPKWMNGWALGPRIGPFALIFNPHIEKHQT